MILIFGINQKLNISQMNIFDLIKSNDKHGLRKIIKEKATNIHQLDNNGSSALDVAIFLNRVEIVKILIDEGIDFTSKDEYGRNALFTACQSVRIDIIKLLISKGINVHETDNYGNSVLHSLSALYMCAKNRNQSTNNILEAIKIMLECGLDYTLKNNNGKICLYSLDEKLKKEMIEKYTLLVDKEVDV